jgi:hypothetical protein
VSGSMQIRLNGGICTFVLVQQVLLYWQAVTPGEAYIDSLFECLKHTDPFEWRYLYFCTSKTSTFVLAKKYTWGSVILRASSSAGSIRIRLNGGLKSRAVPAIHGARDRALIEP